MAPRQALARLTVPVSERDHIWGPAEALVTLLEYGDFECPHCRQAHPAVQSLLAAPPFPIRFVYRHFPLAQVHPHAQQAAEAAEAAGAQEKFWEMHDLLFDNQQALADDDLLQYAALLQLDLTRFATELASHIHAQRVRDQFMSGIHSGVNGTPTFFVNDLRHDGSYNFASLLEAVTEARDEAG